MSRKWVCDECADYLDRLECRCMVKTYNSDTRKPDRCPWEGGALRAVWKRV